MTLTFERAAGLPTLSWCARVERGKRVSVRHGNGVETTPEGFVEGAWDGDFDAFDFDRAASLAGSGGRLRGDEMVFAAPFHPLERLFLLREPDRVLVSNSLVFLLAEAGDQLDICYPHYFFDLLAMVRGGLAAPITRLRTAGGRAAELHPCCNVEVDADLNIRRTEKPAGSPPEDYSEYFNLLLSTTRALAENATAAGRIQKYRMVAACSSGYDSTASSAIASLAGCREGVTFAQSSEFFKSRPEGAAVGDGEDSGAPALRALGMSVTEYKRTDITSVAGHPRAEFFFSPIASTDASTRLMEDQLKGAMFVSGRNGERYWNKGTASRRLNFREVDDTQLSGHALGEFRLRVGFVSLPLPYIGARHGPAIYRITHSAEMRPWTLGRKYDKPIARRIAEEAGVGRELFGQKKRGGGPKLISQESEEDFERFLQAEVPARIRQSLDARPLKARMRMHHRLGYLRAKYSHLPFVATALDVLKTDRMHALWNSTILYRFHWGAAKLRERYAPV